MKKIYIVLIVVVILLIIGLFAFLFPLLGRGQGRSEEDLGMMKLSEVRTCYAQGNYEAARDSILSLRKNFPTALEARRQAILLMDSVELQLAQGDSLKSEFFRRKLEYDKQELRVK